MRDIDPISLAMSSKATSTFVCPLRDLTHLIINTTCTSRLNEHIAEIQNRIYTQLHVNYECLFTYDSKSTPKFFVPGNVPEKRARATAIHDLTRALASDPICFEFAQQGSLACFDIIDIICSFDHCSTYSNVTSLSYMQHDSWRILILGYDSADQ